MWSQGGLLPDIIDLQVKTIKIGAEGVSVFLGDGLADYDIDADIADYLSTDTPAQVLTVRRSATLLTARSTGASVRRSPAPRDLTPGVGQDYSDGRCGGRSRPRISRASRPPASRPGRRSRCGTRRLGATGCSSGRAARSARAGRCRRWLADYAAPDWLELSVFFNGDGTLNMAELGADAVGFFIEDAALGLVLANAQTPQDRPVNNAHQTKKFTALKATAASAGLVGFEDRLRVHGPRHRGRGQLRQPVVGVAPTIDWASSFPGTRRLSVETAIRTTRCCSISAAPRWSGRGRACGVGDRRQRVRFGGVQLPDG